MTPRDKISKSSKKLGAKSKQSNSFELPGWPGYRTRDGRSGYDPIDSRAEAGHTAGTILQKLFTGQIRNPIHLSLLGIFGFGLVIPLILAVSELKNGNLLPWNAWLFFIMIGVIGIAVFTNFIRNLIKIIFR